DMQGRLMGKRFTAHYFLDEVGQDGLHGCAYLLGCDVEMDPQPGYRLTSWAAGYGDFLLRPDLATLRLVPWLDKTALVLCDVYTEGGEPQAEAPRWILKRQVERARALGLEPYTASELEFYLFEETYASARAKHHHDLATRGAYIQDYHVLQTAKDEWLIRQIRAGMDGAGVPVESSKGEWGPGQHEINLRFARAVEMADRHVIYKSGAKEIAALNGAALTFMAKWREDLAGSSFHLHSSMRTVDADQPVFFEAGREPFQMSELFGHYLAGQLALARDFALFFAPTINSYKRFQAASFAPTAIAWGHDNRTCGFRLVGDSAASLRIENRMPGGDANPYLAFAATVAAGVYGIERKLPLPPKFEGDAYRAPNLVRIPGSLREAIACLEQSQVARELFGDTVVEHYLNAARLEQLAYDKAVTCWELGRYFERM
ncbi:MAG: glutamine synthetase family protein, partial [Chloroflexota bacterium]|nr:glutamine synthetase family protein [Chloroflexota bacterium]